MTVHTTGVVTEADRLSNYMLLVAHTLDQLVRIGAAHDLPVVEGEVHALPRRV